MTRLNSDLHIHTTHSDGSMSVGEVLDIAKYKGMDVIAITDHDIVSGIDEAIRYGREIGVKVISGIELSSYSSTSVHMLGYGIDHTDLKLDEVLQDLLDKRQERKDVILEKLAKYNIYIDATRLPTINVGRGHIAREMVRCGHVSCMNEAFDRYLGEHKLAYVPSGRISPLKACELITELGGKAVIAHPMQLYHTGKLNMLIEGLLPHGIAGLEVYYPSHSPEDIDKLIKIADRYGLFYTGGSDFHGQSKSGSHNLIGKTQCELPKELREYIK